MFNSPEETTYKFLRDSIMLFEVGSILKFNVISLNKILPSYKIDKKLKNNYPDWAYKNGK